MHAENDKYYFPIDFFIHDTNNKMRWMFSEIYLIVLVDEHKALHSDTHFSQWLPTLYSGNWRDIILILHNVDNVALYFDEASKVSSTKDTAKIYMGLSNPNPLL